MSFLNLNYQTVLYRDQSSQNPQFRGGGDITKSYQALPAQNERACDNVIGPGETKTIASTLRAITIDSTTELSIERPISTDSVMRLRWTGVGTNPNFRTKRDLDAAADTEIKILRVAPNTMRLSQEAGTAIDTSTIQVGDVIRFERSTDSFTSPLSPGNQGKSYIVQAKGSNYIDFVDNQAAIEEQTNVVLGADYEKVVRVMSSGPVKVGDTLKIDGPYNLSNTGYFTVTDVAYDYVEVQNQYGVVETVVNSSNMFKIYDYLIGFLHLVGNARFDVKLNGQTAFTVGMLDSIDAVFLGSVEAYQVDVTNNSQDTICVYAQLSSLVK